MTISFRPVLVSRMFIDLRRKLFSPALRSSLACCSAFLTAPFASALGFSSWIALFRLCALSPIEPLHPDRSALVSTPVIFARRQLNSNPMLWLAWSAAKHSFRAVKGAHALVAFELAGKTPWACSFGVSFFSMSFLPPFESGEFLEPLSFFTHLMGLREWELCEPAELEFPCAAVEAPAPAGPCAPARSAPTVKERETLRIRTATTKNELFIVTPQWKISGTRLGEAASLSVGHSR